jgi:hypothetical protein
MMKASKTMRAASGMLFAVLFAGCSQALVRVPISVSTDRWNITVTGITRGPDQYNTAGGYWEPRPGKRFIWATMRIRNRLKTDQQFNLDRIVLRAGGKDLRPFIIDMDAAVSLRANPAPRLKPDETITRKLIYIVLRNTIPEKLLYENRDFLIPVSR